MARAGRWMRTLLAYGMPAYLVIVLTIAIQGAMDPWPPADAALARHAGQYAVMVGVATRAVRDPQRGLTTSTARYYILVPGVLRDPRLVKVTRIDQGPVRDVLAHRILGASRGRRGLRRRYVVVLAPPAGHAA
jgi:hypothetical protein